MAHQVTSVKGPEVSLELIKSSQELAAKAAQKAQERLQKVQSLDLQKPPEVPARGEAIHQKAPEIPPKRFSLKKAINPSQNEIAAPIIIAKAAPPLQQSSLSTSSIAAAQQPSTKINLIQKPAPPLPQKPSSVTNSPLMQQKFMNSNRIPQSPQMSLKFPDKIVTRNQPQIINPQPAHQQQRPTSMQPLPKPIVVSKPKKIIQSPSDDLSSEDALRGIESGLRNMERAMQEQLNLRSLEAKEEQMSFNPLEFKQNLRNAGSYTSLDGDRTQSMRNFEAFRMTMEQHFASNMRSLERGFSMEHMRLDNLQHHPPNLRSMESNPNIRSSMDGTFKQMDQQQHQQHHQNARPIEHHMRSLDRHLPLELQYSRQRMREVQDFREIIRQQMMDPRNTNNNSGVMGGGGNREPLTREDIRMRRRSSHDESQMQQAVPGNELFLFPH